MASHPNAIVSEDLQRIVAARLPWERLFNKTVLITGATGFLPAYMLETLMFLNQCANANIRVIGVVRNGQKAAKMFAHFEGRPELIFHVQDVRAPYTGPAGIDFVVHAASPASPKEFGRDPAGTFEANVIGTRAMLEVARQERSQGFLFFSSGEVYGQFNHPGAVVKETDFGRIDPLDPRSCYAEGKRGGEALCAAWHAQHGIPTRIVRISHTYGPGMDLDDGRVFADFVGDVVAGRNIIMKSDGRARRPFCYLADATVAYFTVLLRGNNGEAYNVGSEIECSILNLANLLCRLFPERGCRVVRQNRSPSDSYLPAPTEGGHLDLSKIKALGWEPTTSIDEGFRRTVRSYL